MQHVHSALLKYFGPNYSGLLTKTYFQAVNVNMPIPDLELLGISWVLAKVSTSIL